MGEALEVRSPALLELVGQDVVVERVAAGFAFTEGPVWKDGALLFSDIPNRRIVRWRRLPEGPEVTTFGLGHSNGLTLDGAGNLVAAGHGARSVSRIEADGTRTTLTDTFEGKRLNSPNDLVVKSDGSIYFTDPPFATSPGRGPSTTPTREPGWWSMMIPGKELSFNGVYRIGTDGELSLLVGDLGLPNGIAFAPDERTLYVDDGAAKQLLAFEVLADGTLGERSVLVDMSAADGEGALDGMKVDEAGTIFCTGPGGIWLCRPEGEVLGRIRVPEVPSNLAWGEDGSVLFVTARTSLYRVATKTRGRVLG